MIDSNNINVMREKLRKLSGGGSGVQEEIERIDNLIGSSPIPGTQRTITGSLNYLYDRALKDVTNEEVDTGLKWLDGSSIYFKHMSFSSITLRTGTTNIINNAPNMNKLLYAICYDTENDISYMQPLYGNYDTVNHTLKVGSLVNTTATEIFIIYTKTE